MDKENEELEKCIYVFKNIPSLTIPTLSFLILETF